MRPTQHSTNRTASPTRRQPRLDERDRQLLETWRSGTTRDAPCTGKFNGVGNLFLPSSLAGRNRPGPVNPTPSKLVAAPTSHRLLISPRSLCSFVAILLRALPPLRVPPPTRQQLPHPPHPPLLSSLLFSAPPRLQPQAGGESVAIYYNSNITQMSISPSGGFSVYRTPLVFQHQTTTHPRISRWKPGISILQLYKYLHQLHLSTKRRIDGKKMTA
jgi:hypothetical protein